MLKTYRALQARHDFPFPESKPHILRTVIAFLARAFDEKRIGDARRPVR